MRSLVAALVLLAAPAWAQETTAENVAESEAELPEAHLRVELTPRTITVGDPVRADLILEWPAGAPDIEPRFPAFQETWGQAEILERGSVLRERGPGGRTIFRQTLRLTAFATGEIALPPLLVAIPVAGQTLELETPDDLRLVVESVLPEGEETPEPRAPAAPLALPIGGRFWLVTALLALLVAAAAAAVARRHPDEAFGGLFAKPRLPPYEEFQRRLGTIDPQAGSEPAHTAMSLALRTYLGRATGLMAVERTTSEIRRALRRGEGEVPAELVPRIVTLLEHCDRAKFIAGHQVPPAIIIERRRETEAIVRTIHERQLPADAEAGDTEAGDTEAGDAAGAGAPAREEAA